MAMKKAAFHQPNQFSSYEATGQPVLVMGRSLGTGPTCYVAAHQECAGVVLQSPLYSAMSVVSYYLSWAFWADIFPNWYYAKRHNAPTLIFNGTHDAGTEFYPIFF